jgi:hypothetical protein
VPFAILATPFFSSMGFIMDDTNSSSPSDVTTGAAALPFPAGGTDMASTPRVGAQNDAGYASFGETPSAAAARVADDLAQRARQVTHDVMDKGAEKLSSAAQSVQAGVSKAAEAGDAWAASARDVIRKHPLAAVAGALLVGAAASIAAVSRRH